MELREHFGPGFRIYVGLDGKRFIVLLCGGDKSTQARDLRTAQAYWSTYKASKRRGGGT